MESTGMFGFSNVVLDATRRVLVDDGTGSTPADVGHVFGVSGYLTDIRHNRWPIHQAARCRKLVEGKDRYPPVNIHIAIENGHRNSGSTHQKWWFSIAMLVYQRVVNDSIDCIPLVTACYSQLFLVNAGYFTIKYPHQSSVDIPYGWHPIRLTSHISGYTLVNVYITIWTDPPFLIGKTHYEWSFSRAILT